MASSESHLDFVKVAMALTFVVTLDDLRSPHPIELAPSQEVREASDSVVFYSAAHSETGLSHTARHTAHIRELWQLLRKRTGNRTPSGNPGAAAEPSPSLRARNPSALVDFFSRRHSHAKHAQPFECV